MNYKKIVNNTAKKNNSGKKIPNNQGNQVRNQNQVRQNRVGRYGLPNQNSGKLMENKTNSTTNYSEEKKSVSVQSENTIENESTTINSNETEAKGFINNLPPKTKMYLISAIGSIAFMAIIFLIVIVTPLMALGIIDIEDLTASSTGSALLSGNYTDVANATGYWWPIGSRGTTSEGNMVYANGEPESTSITSYFASQEDFRNNAHNGLDIGNNGNGPGVINVIAAKDGKVVYPTSNNQTAYNDNGYYGNPDGGGFGNYVKIEHNDGTMTVYAHLSKNSITVLAGDEVKHGQVIGKMGNSGSSTGTHLHFEVRVNGNRVDPLNYISASNPRPSNEENNNNIINVKSDIIGNSNEQTVCLNLKENKIPNNAIIAIMTNIDAQSDFNPNFKSEEEFGICKWNSSRYANLQSTYPENYTTINGQIGFLIYELRSSYSDLYNGFINNPETDPGTFTYQFCSEFVKPNDTEETCTNRMNETANYYDYVTNGCQ